MKKKRRRLSISIQVGQNEPKGRQSFASAPRKQAGTFKKKFLCSLSSVVMTQPLARKPSAQVSAMTSKPRDSAG